MISDAAASAFIVLSGSLQVVKVSTRASQKEERARRPSKDHTAGPTRPRDLEHLYTLHPGESCGVAALIAGGVTWSDWFSPKGVRVHVSQ